MFITLRAAMLQRKIRALYRVTLIRQRDIDFSAPQALLLRDMSGVDMRGALCATARLLC